MKRAPKNLILFALAFFFASAVLCATMAAPGQSLASLNGCSQTPAGKTMAECDHSGYLCGFDSAKALLSQDKISSGRSSNSLKTALDFALGAPLIDVSGDLAPPDRSKWRNVSAGEPGKVSVHLVNCVLNL